MNRWICRDFYEEEMRMAFRRWWNLVRIDLNNDIKSRIKTDDATNRYVFLPEGSRDGANFLYRHPGNYESLIIGGFLVIESVFARGFDWRERELEKLPKLPARYFYSNGSRPGVPGWRVGWK